ncbi:MAG: NTP transferase domain-containing protein [Nitrospinae bacterium]|nr:NTP transferase domain-containing protein [Nitrospinota bacterium]
MKQINLLVLAGGFGKRLRSAISEVPKPLAPVKGQPYLHYQIENWVDQGVTQLAFLLHYKADSIEAFLKAHQKQLENCKLLSLKESQPLGTGGAVAFAVQQFGLAGSFLVANADTWLSSGVQQVFDAEIPAIATVKVENSERYGSVKIEKNKIVAFEEKQNSSGPGLINAGLYHLHANLFRDWDGKPFSLERELFPKLASLGQLKSVFLETDFIDMGIPDDYFRICRWIESEKKGVL